MVYAVIDTNMLVSARISKNVSHKAHSFSLYLFHYIFFKLLQIHLSPKSHLKPYTDYHYSPIYHSSHSTKRHKELLSHKCLQIHPTYTTGSFSNGFLK